ncbi:hypothetical protein HPB47_017366 [Ixodes persulcatus]|uniref:Uncharacterized protein n=1 Tax=Ixodes persulcatus TaxID=34615 RepID=A0AC60QNL4_IXOPE|nr:hypothetical protein HPB47_017366 [Ixodes persulcatus]
MANMDETMVRIHTPANGTSSLADASSVRIANNCSARQGFTVALAPSNVPVTASRNGWMTSEKFLEWLWRIWGPNIDDPPIHKTQAAKDAIQERDTDLVYVPAGCTSLLQPADVIWNKPFKASLRRTWEVFVRKEEKTARVNLRKPSRQDVLEFVSEACASVPKENVARCSQAAASQRRSTGPGKGDLHERLADIGNVVPENPDEQRNECVDLIFGSDSEQSFDGFDRD